MASRTTPLHELHLELKAKMVPFAGYLMPLHYRAGILKEHLHTRTGAGLFDVSHMGQLRLTGPGVDRALEGLVPADLLGLPPGRQRYTLLTTANGGIIDDLMVNRQQDCLHLVVNAARKAEDLRHLRDALPPGIGIEVLADSALLALQGPAAAEILSHYASQLRDLPFMATAELELAGCRCRVSRSGYTGEDGFEISLPGASAIALARELLGHEAVWPIGLGARDSLRLEAGLCLYGNDITELTTPVEAGLTWVIPKCRRPAGSRPGGFPGYERIAAQLREGPSRRRVGLRPEGRAPVRAGVPLHDGGGRRVGEVTSGGYGASVGGPVAMGYVESQSAATGSVLEARLRGRSHPVEVVKMPFTPHRYYRG